MTEFTLYCFLESGNAYKAALLLELCQADWEPKKVAFFAGETRSSEYRDINVMGEVPVLVHHLKEDDLSISQSGVILTHLAKHFGKFGAATEAEGREILRWILFDNHKLTGSLATARFRYRFLKKQDDPVTKFYLARTESAWEILDQHLAGRDWVAADRPTIADISLCGYLFWPDHIDADWSGYPNMTAWLDRIKSLPGWKAPEELMPSGMN